MRYGDSRLPSLRGTCIVCPPTLHKRAALLFDRIFVPTGDFPTLDIPPEVTFGHDCGDDHPDWSTWLDFGLNVYAQLESKEMLGFDRYVADMYRGRGFRVIPGYSRLSAYRAEFEKSPNDAVYHAALENIPLASEATAWDQILEFRRDSASRERAIRLLNWLPTGLRAQSATHAEDIIGQMVTDYCAALRKHDLKTVAGGLTLISAVTGISAAAASGALPALFSGLTIAGATTAWLLRQQCDRDDIERGKNGEIAVIYEARRRLPMSTPEATPTT